MSLRVWFSRVAMASVALVAAGCRTNWHRAETTLRSDGSLERSIYQPADQTPAESVRKELWISTRPAIHVDEGQWPGAIRDVPVPADDKAPYIVASGKFASAEKIPKHFVRPTADGSRAGTLERLGARRDFAFAVEHVWSETLTDVVTLDDLATARRDVTHLAIAVVETVLGEALGEGHDVKPLAEWLRGEGTRWFEELTNAYVEVALRRPADRDAALQAQALEICRRHGLNGLDKGDIRAFAAAKLKDLVRDKAGKPLQDETVQEILVWLSLADAPQKEGDDPPENRFEAATKRLIERRYGSEEAFQKRALSLLSRIIGVYGLFAKLERFGYEMTMPGIIVETTGTLAGDARVRWSFTAQDAYPFGYRMQARSIERTELAGRLLDRNALAQRGDLAAFVDLAASDEELQDALKECAAAGSLVAVNRYCIAKGEKPDEQRQGRVRRLERLLKLP